MNGTFIVEVTNGTLSSPKTELTSWRRLGIRRLIKAELIASRLHRVRDRVLAQIAIFVTNCQIDTTVPEIRERNGR